MSEHTGLKSAYELAMERLQKKDEEAGIVRREVTDEDKAAIAEIRSLYQAKIAEVELRYQDRAQTMFDPTERAVLDAEYRRDRERLSDERDRKIERIHNGE
jgi:putative alpha-1,2-mannosidase